MKQPGGATYDEAQRTGIIVMPGGQELRVLDVTLEQFQRIVARHDSGFGRSGNTAANNFRR